MSGNTGNIRACILISFQVVVFAFYLPFVIVVCCQIGNIDSAMLNPQNLTAEHFLAIMLVYLFTALLKPLLTIFMKEDFRNTLLCKPMPVDPAVHVFKE